MQADALTASTIETIERFNEAFNRHDVDAVMGLMTDDCVFESPYPRRMASAMRDKKWTSSERAQRHMTT